jgi:hypothetical protein
MPGIERTGAKLYLVDDAGARWRVHDVVFTEHPPCPVPLGDESAKHRYFVAKDGSLRACTTCRSESRRFVFAVGET